MTARNIKALSKNSKDGSYEVLSEQKSLSSFSWKVSAPCADHTWERTKREETQQRVKGLQIKHMHVHSLLKQPKAK